MAENTQEKQARRKRIERMKKILIAIAVFLIMSSLILNIVLLFRVIHLGQMMEQLNMII